jgi:hypothetical protein
VLPALHRQLVIASRGGTEAASSGHALHSALPRGANSASKHGRHSLPDTAAAAADAVPPSHLVQAAGPTASLNRPAPQAEQLPPSGPV